MTCIVGLIEKKKVWMGADALASSWMSETVLARPKVFIKGKFIFGFAGSLVLGQILEHQFNPPPQSKGVKIIAYMVSKFIPSLKKKLKSVGFLHTHNTVESIGDYSIFMVGYKGRLFTIWNNYGVSENACGYDSIGSGTNTARGSLHSSGFVNDELMGIDPYNRIEMALEASEEHNPGVRGPFTILSA